MEACVYTSLFTLDRDDYDGSPAPSNTTTTTTTAPMNVGSLPHIDGRLAYIADLRAEIKAITKHNIALHQEVSTAEASVLQRLDNTIADCEAELREARDLHHGLMSRRDELARLH